MKLEETVKRIVELEWPMFHSVNGETREDCQEDPSGFERLRAAQFSAWSPAAAESYLRDLETAAAQGRNLAREKYIRMMKHTDPEGYAAFQGELPPLDGEQEALIAAIWGRMLVQTERLRERYPAVALGGRPLRAAEETEGQTSVETYQTGELATYSAATLRALLAHIEALEAQGRDLAFEIQRNSVQCMGYADLDAAERAMAYAFLQSVGGGACETCGALEDRTLI